MSFDEEELMGGIDPLEDEDLIDPLVEPEEFDLNDYEEEDPDKDH